MKDELAVALGKRGGDRTKEKYGLDHFKFLSMKAARKRTKKARSKALKQPKQRLITLR